jgi:Sulfotransferase family
MFPDFIGIGAQKAGTTWLHRNLQAHPQIFMPRKEIHYFDKKINDHSNARTRLFGTRKTDDQWRRQVKHWTLMHLIKKPSLRDLLWDFKYYMFPYNDQWYASVFEPKKGKVAGEITPAYSVLDRDSVVHVHELVPDAKIIFFMRNPIERVWSQTVMSFDRAKKGSAESVSEEQLFQRSERDSMWKLSNYLRTFENWGACYSEARIFVGFLEDIHFFPRELLRSLYGFLGVNPSFDPPLTEKKVHSRSAGSMPTRIAVHLARTYQEEITRLSERFGGYASFWLFCANRLVDDPPEEENMPYPMFESSLWEEWTSGAGASAKNDLHSGPLASIQVAT